MKLYKNVNIAQKEGVAGKTYRQIERQKETEQDMGEK